MSAWPEKRGEIVKVCEIVAKRLKELGASNVELADIGQQTLPDNTKIPLPPLVFANLGADPKKKTILIYGHLDVQPAALVRDRTFSIFFRFNLIFEYNSRMVGTRSHLF